MDDIFLEIYDDLVKNDGDFSRLYHAAFGIVSDRFSKLVHEMSDEDLIQHLTELGRHKLKEQGRTMSAAEFYKRIMMCKRQLRGQFRGVGEN